MHIEYEEVQQVASSNQRRDDRLAKVRGRDFTVKLERIEVRGIEKQWRKMCDSRCVLTTE